MMTTFTNEANGIEAIVTEGNTKFSHRVIFRDTDANATISVLFADEATCIAKAKNFVA